MRSITEPAGPARLTSAGPIASSTPAAPAFGLLQGGGVSVNKLYQIVMTKRLGKKRFIALGNHPLHAACMRGLTFTFFAFSLFWFWSTWTQMGSLIAALCWSTLARSSSPPRRSCSPCCNGRGREC
ncbi:hypothetical protein [Burkholderia pseudomultivorans]|uniref:hypothetical protein n=1 Tax=Burkholderia pseudomultivorans TaxID=1207504 RepID=UPI000B32FB21|nr:hypothetical protein [Burkholderia pseudomultivorans]